jgi:hypothetical protein
MQVTVREWERGVLLRDGRYERVLEPGRHRLPRRRHEVARVDVRERVYTVAQQEILTADSVAVRLSVTAVWRVTDPRRYLTVAADATARLHTALQLAVRRRVAATPLEQLLAGRDAVAAGLAAEVAGDVEGLGVARERGRADLERARAEAAALRSLANTARLLEEHPGLLHLRTLQAAGHGATLIVAPPGSEPNGLVRPPRQPGA